MACTVAVTPEKVHGTNIGKYHETLEKIRTYLSQRHKRTKPLRENEGPRAGGVAREYSIVSGDKVIAGARIKIKLKPCENKQG